MLFVFWDIDGTLLTTGRAGIIAWERAVLEVCGARLDFSQQRTAGLTDTEIAVTLARAGAPTATPEMAAQVLRHYEVHLPDCLPLRAGSVLPGVVPILERLRTLGDVHCSLLTGNTRAGAAAKLDYYGLQKYFSSGAFADGCRDRIEVAGRARDMVLSIAATASEARVFVVGDTPNDIHCAAAIGARAIAVATGEYGAAELRAHRPDSVLESLPAPDGFLALLDAPGVLPED
jgi:phosphoglycolate phosphatase-like HAD superfamily hydrolase